jgi:hypothetical protein
MQGTLKPIQLDHWDKALPSPNPKIAMNRLRWFLPWVGLAGVLALFVSEIIRLHPQNFFGYVQDDSIYFSSAKALAEGRGYVLLSVPKTPPATKYPILYPYILSYVWRLNPSFPENLPYAEALSVVFGIGFIVVAFLFFKDFEAIGRAESLLLTAFCALHPIVLFYSGNVLSDVPFAAVALGAMLGADRGIRREGRPWRAMLCGVLVGLATLLRAFGLPVAAGILIAGFVRRAWRQLLVFSACVAPFLVVLLWRVIFPGISIPVTSGTAQSSLGWRMTWIYYTGYLLHWKLSVPNTHILREMLQNNAEMILRGISDYFFFPLASHATQTGKVLVAAISGITLIGTVRLARHQEWKPIHFVLPCYAALVMFWNFPDVLRYFIPFLPLFAIGLSHEGKHIIGMARTTLAKGHPLFEKAIAASLGVVVVGLTSGILLNYVVGLRRVIARQSRDRGELLREKREAYDWISSHTARETRVIAYEDAVVYLYTGRQSLRPIAFTTAEYYEPTRINVVLKHIADVARAIEAQYWIISDDDFGDEWPDATLKTRTRLSELEKVLPLVFRSRRGQVRVYGLGCVQNPGSSPCAAADYVLFPAD